MKFLQYIALPLLMLAPAALLAADGSGLWLPPAPASVSASALAPIKALVTAKGHASASASVATGGEMTLAIARAEVADIEGVRALVATADDPAVRSLFARAELRSLSEEEFLIRSLGGDTVVVVGASPRAALYGAYRLLRDHMSGQRPVRYNLRERPAYELRLLNHWDNLDGTIERGYAGYSIWWEHEEPQTALWQQYARANASVGINGTVVNNVNATPEMLTAPYLARVKVIADVLRPYGITTYLSINFSSPAVLGPLPTSDPLDKRVAAWWRTKVAEIYALIPDFGGFLVKANSEGLPGPQDFGRTHVDGANMLADALAPHKGVVMWRAFVYNPTEPDRAKQAYDEFMPFDGKFRDNVIVQVKNGPVDFQPREPFSPLFGAMRRTSVMSEFQITQEYLGFSNHLAYLAPLFKECLDSDTYAAGVGSTVARATDGSLYKQTHTAIAGVANIGLDASWCGHPFAQANWYAFGRLAWDHSLTSEQIAEEWLRQTFTTDSAFVEPVKEMMLTSRETVVDYMMPLGLHHIFAWDHHYGPEPWCEIEGARADWLPSYYHKASVDGVGFDRSSRGSNAVAQYSDPLRSLYDNPATCPDNLLLWFHHVAWDHVMPNGMTLWEQLCRTYDRGVLSVREMQRVWDRMAPYVDAARFEDVQSRLRTQSRDAVWWRDACVLYFQTHSRRPIPYDLERPVHELEELKKIKLNMKHHN